MARRSGLALLASTALLGLSLAWGASAADVATSCTNCHGADGASTDPHVPIIGGLSAEFLSSTMKAYKAKERPCPEATYLAGDKKGQKSDMCQIANALSDADVAQAASFFAGKKFARAKQKADPALAAKGKEIHEKQCDKCHTEGGSVAGDDAGILAGQWMPYLSAQLKDFKEAKRLPPKKMQPKLDELQPGDLDALVNFYGSEQ